LDMIKVYYVHGNIWDASQRCEGKCFWTEGRAVRGIAKSRSWRT
jgi:hypothetical protein